MANVKCPHCGSLIDIDEALQRDIKAKFEDEILQQKRKWQQQQQNEATLKFEAEIAAKREEYAKHLAQLQAKENAFEQRVKAATDSALNSEREKILALAKSQIESENAAKFEILQKELQEKSQRISELNLIKAEMEAQKRKFSELEAENKAKSEIELTNRVNQERERLSKQISQENELKFRQKDEQIQSLIGQINELKRRSEVGSQQLQGEVQELALQEYLRLNFPLDEIDEVKKGARGADCVQIVHTREFAGCGKILYESMRT